jgi:hypothetical protein
MAHVVLAELPVQASDTVPANPFRPTAVTTYVALRPCTVCEAGDTDRAKSTTSATGPVSCSA